MTYLLTFENGPTKTLSSTSRDHFLRDAIRRRHPVTRVRGGHVVTLPGGRMVAIIAGAA
nr:hypothetical protein [Streptomyces antibioticus]